MARPFLDLAQSRRIVTLAAPVVFAMLTQAAINIVDTYFMKRLPCADASDAQAALTPALMLVWAVGGFLSAISVGTIAIVARRFGEQRYEDAGAVLINAAMITFVGGAVLTVAGWLAMPTLFGIVVDSPHVAQLGTTYARWRFVGIIPMAATAAYKGFFDGIGKTQLHLWAALVANIVNVALCWLLIFGHLGFPRLGIAGAGIASSATSWLMFALMVAFSTQRTYVRRFRFYRRANTSRAIVRDLLKLSVPGGFATVAVMSGFLLFTKIVARLDVESTTALVRAGECGGVRLAVNGAATTIIIEVLSATFVTCMALGTATATLVGQNLGAGDPTGAERYAWTSVKLGTIFAALLGALIFVKAEAVLGVFTDAPGVIAAGARSMRLVAALQWMLAIAMVLTQALFGAGDTRYVMIVEMCLHFGCLVPLSWVLGIVMGFGLIGVWWAAAAYVALLCLAMGVRFRRGGWKRLAV